MNANSLREWAFISPSHHKYSQSICESFFAGKKRLRHVRRPQQGYYMSQINKERHFCQKKAPAARKNASTGLLHVITNPGTSFLPKKRRLRHVRRPQQGYYMSQTNQERFFAEQKDACGSASHTHMAYKYQGTPFFPKKKGLRQCITHTQGIKIPGIQERLISQMALAIFVM